MLIDLIYGAFGGWPGDGEGGVGWEGRGGERVVADGCSSLSRFHVHIQSGSVFGAVCLSPWCAWEYSVG